MPPLKGIDRLIDGDLLKALEETGHGQQIVIVDPSYAIPHNSQRANYHGDSSARALRSILDLVPVDQDETGDYLITLMAPDPPAKNSKALRSFRTAIQDLKLETITLPRMTD